MSVNKIVTKVDGTINKTIDFNDLAAGLSAGAHTITVEAFNGATLVSTQTKNITIAAVAAYDVDYQAKLDKATELGIPHPSTSQSAIYNQRTVDLKPTTGWINSSVLFDFSGVADIQFKLLCLKRRVLAIAYGGGVWSTQGWLGNAINSYIDPLYVTGNDTNWQLNSAAISWLSFQKGTKGTLSGNYNGGTNNYTLLKPNFGTKSYHSINGDATQVPTYGIVGFNSVSRISSSEILINGASKLSGSNTVMNGKLVIGAWVRADLGDEIQDYTDEGIGFVMMGGKITATDYATIKSILE